LRWEAERVDGKSPAEAIYQACLCGSADHHDDSGCTAGRAAAPSLRRVPSCGARWDSNRGWSDFQQMLTLYTTPVVYSIWIA